MTNVTWELIPGSVRINATSVVLLIDHPDVKIWEIDVDSKYPEVGSYMIDDEDRFHIYINAGERTLNVDPETEKDTIFRIEGLDYTWVPVIDANKYTVQVVMYNSKDRD